jgi:hypothetical protein
MASVSEKKPTLLAALAGGPKDIHGMHAAVIRIHPEERKLSKNRTGSVRQALANDGLIEPAGSQRQRNVLWKLTPLGKMIADTPKVAPVAACSLVIQRGMKQNTYTFTVGSAVFVFTPDSTEVLA